MKGAQRCSSRHRKLSMKAIEWDEPRRVGGVPVRFPAHATASDVEILSPPPNCVHDAVPPAKRKSAPSPLSQKSPASSSVNTKTADIRRKGMEGVTRNNKKSRVISNLTISHALLESKTCYYEGALPPITFDLRANDILIAPGRMINCDHQGTLNWVHQFLAYAQCCLTYPRRRDAIVASIVGQLPGKVYSLNCDEQAWEAVRDWNDLFNTLGEILDNTLDYHKQTCLRLGPPSENGRPTHIHQTTEQKRQVSDEISEKDLIERKNQQSSDEDNGKKSCTQSHSNTQKYWSGLGTTFQIGDDSNGFPIDVCQNDVLLSQKALWKRHPGTFYFGGLLRSTLEVRQRSETGPSNLMIVAEDVAEDAIETVHRFGGRFFQQEVNTERGTIWHHIEDKHDLKLKITDVLRRMQRLDVGKPTLPRKETLHHRDVLLSLGHSYSGHFGTDRFLLLVMKVVPFFIKAEVGHVLAGKIREEIHNRHGCFWSNPLPTKTSGRTISSDWERIKNNSEIELGIVHLLEHFERVDLQRGAVSDVPFRYPQSAVNELSPPPNQRDVFWATQRFESIQAIPPGNIRFLRMIRDRCALRPDECDPMWAIRQAQEVISRVQSYGGRFLMTRPNGAWYTLTEQPIILAYAQAKLSEIVQKSEAKSYQNGVKEGPTKDPPSDDELGHVNPE